jgi:hypothetical protein
MDNQQVRPEQPIYTPQPATTGTLPPLAHIRQHFEMDHIADVSAAVVRELGRYAPAAIRPGMRVAITAGSRGIANIPEIIATVVHEVRRLGAEPFVVAAMGSHGGATSAGQRAVLSGYGITEERVGCPIIADMETVCLGHTADGVAAYIDRAAYEADAIIVVNRVKPHSILTGDLGSGLMKMTGIGLGNAIGADSIHLLGVEQHLLPVARLVLEQAPVALGLAIVENARDETWQIACVPPAEMEAADRRLLAEARRLLPTIPFDPIDVLIVEMMGKNFSGTGMDPNVIGMHRRIGGPARRDIRRIVVLDLSPESHGNAHGIGMADIVTARLCQRIDWNATYTNGLTADFLGGGKLPLTCPGAREAIELALKPFPAEQARVVWIHDTAHLEELWISPVLLADLARWPHLEQLAPARPINLDVL